MWWSIGLDLPSSKSQLLPIRRTTDLSFFAALARATIAQGLALPFVAPNAGNSIVTSSSAHNSGIETRSNRSANAVALNPGFAPTIAAASRSINSNSVPPIKQSALSLVQPGADSPVVLPIQGDGKPGLSTSGGLQGNLSPVDHDQPQMAALPLSMANPLSPAPVPSIVTPLIGSSALPMSPTDSLAWGLTDYPRPSGDTGRGFDWIPTLQSDSSTVDRFVDEAKKMGASWMVILNDGTQVGNNDYLVQRLVANHIEPIMRIYTSHGSPITGDLTSMVRHYVQLGVHYFVPYNEPNLPDENPNGQVSVSGYVDRWIPAAQAIVDGGGLPGLGSLAPGAPVDDVSFLRSTLQEIQSRGASNLLNHGWIAMHNYTFNRPINYQADSNGFLKFRWYDQTVRAQLGRSLPIIGTEGGPRMGDNLDSAYPTVDEARRDQLALDSFAYLPKREPYLFANTLWVLANEAGGGRDHQWSADALFAADGSPTSLAQALLSQKEDA